MLAAQNSTATKIYSVNHWEALPPLVLFASSPLIFRALEKNASLTLAEAQALNPQSVNSFDRPACFYDPGNFANSTKSGELVLTISVVSPLILLLDKKISRDWADLLALLLVTHGVDNALYYTSSLAVRAPRPLTYNPEVPIEEKVGEGKTNSFFSGHTAWTSTSTFFVAKVYTDYHHIRGIKRLLIYSAAAVPPTLEGYYRVHAGRHFASDAIIGGIVGAACGIIIPELHRIKTKDSRVSIKPFFLYGANGMSVSYNIK